jgi:hypothetical protein
MDNRPIFIGGIERSGTSLLYALLASHPNIAMTRRMNLWPYFFHRYGDLNQPENRQRCLSVMKQYRRVATIDLDFERLENELSHGEVDYKRLFTLLWEQYAEKLGKPRWGDKSLNTERYADEIFQIYPNAKILQIIRDPRDRYASALKRWKVIRGGVGSGTAMWLSSVRIGNRNLRKYPGRYRFVRYETLAQQPEATMRELCAFLEEEYEPEVLLMQGAENFRDEGGNSSFEQYEPGIISTRSIGRYRRYLNSQDIAYIQQFTRREMSAQGYPLDPIDQTLRTRLHYYGVHLPVNLARMVLWSGREAYFDQIGRAIPSSRMVHRPEDGVPEMARH